MKAAEANLIARREVLRCEVLRREVFARKHSHELAKEGSYGLEHVGHYSVNCPLRRLESTTGSSLDPR